MDSQPKKHKTNTGRWTRAQHRKFMDAIDKYGKNWCLIERKIKTRTALQIRSHAQKVFLQMSKEDVEAFMGIDAEEESSVSLPEKKRKRARLQGKIQKQSDICFKYISNNTKKLQSSQFTPQLNKHNPQPKQQTCTIIQEGQKQVAGKQVKIEPEQSRQILLNQNIQEEQVEVGHFREPLEFFQGQKSLGILPQVQMEQTLRVQKNLQSGKAGQPKEILQLPKVFKTQQVNQQMESVKLQQKQKPLKIQQTPNFQQQKAPEPKTLPNPSKPRNCPKFQPQPLIPTPKTQQPSNLPPPLRSQPQSLYNPQPQPRPHPLLHHPNPQLQALQTQPQSQFCPRSMNEVQYQMQRLNDLERMCVQGLMMQRERKYGGNQNLGVNMNVGMGVGMGMGMGMNLGMGIGGINSNLGINMNSMMETVARELMMLKMRRF